MSIQNVESCPHFPAPPSGISRKSHLPTVLASLHYWEAIRLHALRVRDLGLAQTATGLRLSYEAARHELLKMERTPEAIRRRGTPQSPEVLASEWSRMPHHSSGHTELSTIASRTPA